MSYARLVMRRLVDRVGGAAVRDFGLRVVPRLGGLDLQRLGDPPIF